MFPLSACICSTPKTGNYYVFGVWWLAILDVSDVEMRQKGHIHLTVADRGSNTKRHKIKMKGCFSSQHVKANAYFLLPQSHQIHRQPWADHQNLHKNF